MDTGVRQRQSRAVTLTVRGSALLGAAVLAVSVAYIAGWPELLILGCFCGLAPLLALAVVSRSTPRVTVSRFTSPAILSAGTTGSVRLRLRFVAGSKMATAQWSDDLPWSPGHTTRQPLPEVDVEGNLPLQYSFVPPRRGIVEIGPLVIDVVDPFGLAKAEFPVGQRRSVTVAPETVDLSDGAVDIAVDSGSARLFQHRAIAGEHDIMTRDYRPGDALRRVHWKASAHYGELMVREDEKRSHAEAHLLLDTRRSNWGDTSRAQAPDLPESAHFEWALSMTASLRDYFIRNGMHVNVAETAVSQLADASNADDFIESLARVRLSYQDGPALRLAAPSAESVGSLFVVLDEPDSDTIDALVEQRGSFDFAAAFLLGPARPGTAQSNAALGNTARNSPAHSGTEDRLERAGWVVHRVGTNESVLEAWRALATGGDRVAS